MSECATCKQLGETLQLILKDLDKAENLNDDELRDLIYSIIDDYGGDLIA